MRGLLGIGAMLVVALALSEARRAIPWRVVVGGVTLQVAIAAMFLKLPAAVALLVWLDHGIEALQSATQAGTALVFGYLGGGPLPYAETVPGGSFVLAFRALPLVLVVSAIAALLVHWGILQRIVGALAFGLGRTLGIGGAVGVTAAAHIFVGMIEAPLLVRPYLREMSRGELFAVMSCGMAGIAGTVMVIYATILGQAIPAAFSNILVASVLSTPGALAVSSIMVPFSTASRTEATLDDGGYGSAMEAIVRGTMDGIGLLAAIVAMLIVLVALVTLGNDVIGLVPVGGAPLSLQRIFAYGFRPLLWLIGIPWEQSGAAALLLGTKTILNEFVAYLSLAGSGGTGLDAHSRLIMTYALCGFANLGSLGILVGGLVAMVPERRAEITALGARSLVSGTISTCLSGALAGLLVGG